MPVTEADATLRYCPLLHQNCIAKQCMFWRSRDEPLPFDNQRRDSYGNPIMTVRVGYCGLAGKDD